MYHILNAHLGVSDEALQLITHINGFSKETMEDVLFAVSGYRDFETWMQSEC